MSKKKGTDEKKLIPGREFSDHNMNVAMWGPFSEERYSEARQIVEGWSTACTYETALQQRWTEPTSQREKQCLIDKRPHLNKKLQDFASKTLAYVRKAVEARDAEAIRKIADIIGHLNDVTERGAEDARSLDVALLTLYVRAKPAHHVFTFAELRNHLAEAEGRRPPYHENFEQRVRRIIKKIGVKVQKKRR